MPKNNPEPRTAHIFSIPDREFQALKSLAAQAGVSIAQYCEDLIMLNPDIEIERKEKCKNRNINMSATTWARLKERGDQLGVSACSVLRGLIGPAALVDVRFMQNGIHVVASPMVKKVVYNAPGG